MASFGMSLETSVNWKFVQETLMEGVRPIVREEQLALVAGASEFTAETARLILDGLVYEAPLPPSAYFAGWATQGNHVDKPFPMKWVFVEPGTYDERSRIGRLHGAIKAAAPTEIGDDAIGKAGVDRADFPSYFYALSVEYGMLDRYATYYPRPFWRMTKEVMKSEFPREGRSALRRIRVRIWGRFA